jgi:hypothetical protein
LIRQIDQAGEQPRIVQFSKQTPVLVREAVPQGSQLTAQLLQFSKLLDRRLNPLRCERDQIGGKAK